MIELNKLDVFNLGDMSHCGTSHEDMIVYYGKNSSPLSFYVEQFALPRWYSNLEYDTTRVIVEGVQICPDLRCEDLMPNILDQKAFNMNGADFNWSRGKGQGRTTGGAGWKIWCHNQIFVFTDFCNLPEVRVIALTGEECLRRWPSGKITFKDREKLFSMATELVFA
jgi:hypothetical protein